jgi:hypothetical protein
MAEIRAAEKGKMGSGSKALRALDSVKKPKGANSSARAANLQIQPCDLVRPEVSVLQPVHGR